MNPRQLRGTTSIKRFLFLFALVATITFSSCNDKEQSLELSSVGFLPGGGVQAVAVQSDTVFVGVGASLVVLDITTPEDPKPIASLTLPARITDIQIHQNHAFVTLYDSWNGIYVIAVSDLARLTVAGTYKTETIQDLVLNGDYLFLTQSGYSEDSVKNEIQIYDISNLSAITLVATHEIGTDKDTSLGQMVNNGKYLFVDVFHPLPQPRQLQILDISVPTQLKPVSSYALPEGATIHQIEVVGDHVLLSTHLDYEIIELVDLKPEVLVLDVADPVNPIQIASYQSWNVVVSEDYVFIPMIEGPWYVLDISGDYALQQLGQIDAPLPSNPTGKTAFIENKLLLTYWDAGLRIIDASSPFHLAEIGAYHTLGSIQGLAVIDETTLMNANSSGFQVANFAQSDKISVLSRIDIPGYDLAVMDGFAYVTTWEEGLFVIDISDPARANVISTKAVSKWGHYVAADNNDHIYLVSGWEIWVLDVSDPEHLREVGYYSEPVDENSTIYPPTDISFSGIAILGNYAYLVTDGHGLHIFDVSEPENPVKVEVREDPERYYRIAAGDELLFAVSRTQELFVLNVIEPTSPTVEDRLPITSYYTDEMYAVGNRVYLPLRSGGIEIYQPVYK
jgi:hypothetical protein